VPADLPPPPPPVPGTQLTVRLPTLSAETAVVRRQNRGSDRITKLEKIVADDQAARALSDQKKEAHDSEVMGMLRQLMVDMAGIKNNITISTKPSSKPPDESKLDAGEEY
jgi:hypothetical protein